MSLSLAVVVVALALLTGCSCGEDEPPASDDLACRYFREVAGDYMDGVLTDTELLAKLHTVDSIAQVGSDPVASASREVLAAFTPPQASEAEQAQAVETFRNACEAQGL
ncbi:MAG: hypothetical protein U5R31_14820 [Acidimicrobiia bacterium]|nr:hypothetical protein [Acidimicrobiia bacterium]